MAPKKYVPRAVAAFPELAKELSAAPVETQEEQEDVVKPAPQSPMKKSQSIPEEISAAAPGGTEGSKPRSTGLVANAWLLVNKVLSSDVAVQVQNTLSSKVSVAKESFGQATSAASKALSSTKDACHKKVDVAITTVQSYKDAAVQRARTTVDLGMAKVINPCLAKASSIVSTTTQTALSYMPEALRSRVLAITDATQIRARRAADFTMAKSRELKVRSCEIAAQPKVQVTAASAAGGAVTVGATGGAIGFTAGGVIGAACGVIPAIFTFGLSIPVGAAIGSGAGLCVGTAVGGTAGAVGGGAVGFGAYSKKDEIKQGVDAAKAKADACKRLVKDKASMYAENVKETASALKARLPGSTGETS